MMRYLHCCVDSDAESIQNMLDSHEEATVSELRENIAGLDDWAVAHGYELDPDDGLTLDDDWHVSAGVAVYRGEPCWFLRWSGIEFIWTESGDSEGWGYGSIRED